MSTDNNTKGDYWRDIEFLDGRVGALERAFTSRFNLDDQVGALVANITDPEWGPGATYNHGAIGDGRSHPLRLFFTTLKSARMTYPFLDDDGLDDELDWAAIQKATLAHNAVGGTGSFVLGGRTITRTSDAPYTFFGAGPAATQLRQTGDAAVFHLSKVTQGALPGATHTLLAGMTITAASGGVIADAAIHLDGHHNYPSGVLREIVVDYEAASTFQRGVWLTDCAGVTADAISIFGTSDMQACWYMDTINPSAGGSSGDHKFVACKAYGAHRGAQVANTLAPGIEGLDWQGCTFLTDIGVEVVNSAIGYGEPGFTWSGGHMNCSELCFYFVNAELQIAVTGGALLYYSGNDEFMRIVDCIGVTVDSSVKFVYIGSGDPDGIVFEHPNLLGGSYSVQGCKFQLKAGGTGYAVRTDSNPTFYATYDRITVEGGAGVLDLQHINPSIVVGTNFPPDASDQFDYVSITGGDTLDFSLKRARFLSIVDPGTPTTVTTIDGRRQNEDFTLQFPIGSNVTIEHNANILLKGSIDFVGSTSALLHLRLIGANWVETGRVQ